VPEIFLNRVGSPNRRPEALPIEELTLCNRMDSPEEQAGPDLKANAIDFRIASTSFAPQRKLTPKSWSTLRGTTEHRSRPLRTIGGLLRFGSDRFFRFPDAWGRVALWGTGTIQGRRWNVQPHAVAQSISQIGPVILPRRGAGSGDLVATVMPRTAHCAGGVTRQGPSLILPYPRIR
jgi:hypothetical protein